MPSHMQHNCQTLGPKTGKQEAHGTLESQPNERRKFGVQRPVLPWHIHVSLRTSWQCSVDIDLLTTS